MCQDLSVLQNGSDGAVAHTSLAHLLHELGQ